MSVSDSVGLELNTAVDLMDTPGVTVALSNAAHVDATLDLEESFVAPGGAPGVLDVPELHASCLIIAVAYGQDGVVDVV